MKALTVLLAAWLSAQSDAVKPFVIDVPDEVLADLKERLARTRFPDQLVGVTWDYGTDRAYLEELVSYWRDEFDWRAQERRLNAFDQFETTIDGLSVHFLHVRSSSPNAVPLLLVHGWPGSIAEFAKVIGPLTEPQEHGGRPSDAFHVVAPSLAGYGFSGKPTAPGFGPEQVADVHAKLMERLGYGRYGLQGGDWGAIVNRWLAFKYPERVSGLHLNFVLGAAPEDPDDPYAGVPESESRRHQERQQFLNNELGYAQIQSTRPQTLGYGLNDSPAGLAAWIIEKFRAWCDCRGDIESAFTKDELLTNVMIYWVTETISSSTRLYFESRSTSPSVTLDYVDVPTGVSVFPKELMLPPRRWVETKFNVTQWTEMPRGGHFAALEQPELLVEDIRKFFATLR